MCKFVKSPSSLISGLAHTIKHFLYQKDRGGHNLLQPKIEDDRHHEWTELNANYTLNSIISRFAHGEQMKIGQFERGEKIIV